jgi:TolA-binding protein
MTREQAKNILGENATEEQITNLLNAYHVNESKKVKELENQINSLNEQNSKYSDYDEIKKQLDEINKANMSEQEKLEAQKKEIETNLKNSRIIVNTAKAKEILAGLDLDDDLISLVVSDDANKTIDSANKLKAKFDSQKETVAKQTKESLANLNLDPTLPNVNQGEGKDVIDTFEKFGKLSATEQEKWINEHPNEFENLV